MISVSGISMHEGAVSEHNHCMHFEAEFHMADLIMFAQTPIFMMVF
jgi:hypothetical protein